MLKSKWTIFWFNSLTTLSGLLPAARTNLSYTTFLQRPANTRCSRLTLHIVHSRYDQLHHSQEVREENKCLCLLQVSPYKHTVSCNKLNAVLNTQLKSLKRSVATYHDPLGPSIFFSTRFLNILYSNKCLNH